MGVTAHHKPVVGCLSTALQHGSLPTYARPPARRINANVSPTINTSRRGQNAGNGKLKTLPAELLRRAFLRATCNDGQPRAREQTPREPFFLGTSLSRRGAGFERTPRVGPCREDKDDRLLVRREKEKDTIFVRFVENGLPASFLSGTHEELHRRTAAHI